MREQMSSNIAAWEFNPRCFFLVRPAAHVCLCGESPLIARSEEDLATRQSQGGIKLMKKADSEASARHPGI